MSKANVSYGVRFRKLKKGYGVYSRDSGARIGFISSFDKFFLGMPGVWLRHYEMTHIANFIKTL